MIKSISLFIGTILFLYLAYASNHYLVDYWFEGPTRIIMIFIVVIHLILLALNVYSEWLKQAIKAKENK